jgi:hypothetical protein
VIAALSGSREPMGSLEKLEELEKEYREDFWGKATVMKLVMKLGQCRHTFPSADRYLVSSRPIGHC